MGIVGMETPLEERREKRKRKNMDVYICIEQLLDDVELVRSGI